MYQYVGKNVVKMYSLCMICTVRFKSNKPKPELPFLLETFKTVTLNLRVQVFSLPTENDRLVTGLYQCSSRNLNYSGRSLSDSTDDDLLR